jgi:hypothetical protein
MDEVSRLVQGFRNAAPGLYDSVKKAVLSPGEQAPEQAPPSDVPPEEPADKTNEDKRKDKRKDKQSG